MVVSLEFELFVLFESSIETLKYNFEIFGLSYDNDCYKLATDTPAVRMCDRVRPTPAAHFPEILDDDNQTVCSAADALCLTRTVSWLDPRFEISNISVTPFGG